MMIVKDWIEEFVNDYDETSPKKRPQIQGIKGFFESEQKEIESPMRKKKGGLKKLSLKVTPTKKSEKE